MVAVAVDETPLITVKHRLDAGRQLTVGGTGHRPRTEAVVVARASQGGRGPLARTSGPAVAENWAVLPRVCQRRRGPAVEAGGRRRLRPLLHLTTDWKLVSVLVDLVRVRMVQNGSRQIQIAVEVSLVKAGCLGPGSWQQWLRQDAALDGGIFDLPSHRPVLLPASLAGSGLRGDGALADGVTDQRPLVGLLPKQVLGSLELGVLVSVGLEAVRSRHNAPVGRPDGFDHRCVALRTRK